MGIGVGVGFTLNTLLNILATSNGGKAVALFAYPLPFIAFIASFSAVVGFLTGIFPARRAAALNPLDAIRYK
jgi:putative ABC transport system permease protein